jgi:ketosteroid isomerase-like protein
MKKLLALFAVLWACFAASGFALSGDLAGNTRALEHLGELNLQLKTALREDNALGLAALFTEEAVCVTPQGVLVGREAIAEGLEHLFAASCLTSQVFQIDQLHSWGNDAWSVGQWWTTLQSLQGTAFLSGYWSAILVQDGGTWKMRMLTLSETSRHGSGRLAGNH